MVLTKNVTAPTVLFQLQAGNYDSRCNSTYHSLHLACSSFVRTRLHPASFVDASSNIAVVMKTNVPGRGRKGIPLHSEPRVEQHALHSMRGVPQLFSAATKTLLTATFM